MSKISQWYAEQEDKGLIDPDRDEWLRIRDIEDREHQDNEMKDKEESNEQRKLKTLE